MVIYDSDTINLIFFSPYTQIWTGEKGVTMRNPVFETQCHLEADREWCRDLCRMLRDGTEPGRLREHLQTVLSRKDARKMLRVLTERGLIE